jgi:hypothetical protein
MSIRVLSSVFLAVLLVASLLAAASGGSVELSLSKPAFLAGKPLEAGKYLVRWKSQSPEAVVKFESHGTVVAEVNARIEERNPAPMYDTIVTVKNAAGALAVKEIWMAGKKQVLVFDQR